MLRSARLTLKQHRFEVGAGALGLILVGAAALWVNSRMLGVIVPGGCFQAWMNTGPFGLGPECEIPVRLFFEINESEAGKVFGAMSVLPIAAGILAGVALVGRELEARTAQTAWGLAASRRRWFGRQLWPVLLVLGVAVTFAAFSASILETTRRVPSSYPFMDLGLYGPIAVSRGFGALGLGLFVGAALGRTLPAFIIGAVLSVVLVSSAGVASYQWASAQPRVVLEGDDAETGMSFDSVWQAEDGRILTEDQAIPLVPPEGSDDPYAWLNAHGYRNVSRGITAETARGWDPIEIGAFAALGLVLVLGTLVVVDRRRPT